MNEESIDNNITFIPKWSSDTLKIKEIVSSDLNLENTLNEDVKPRNYFLQDFHGLPKENVKSEKNHFLCSYHLGCSLGCSKDNVVDPVSNQVWLLPENLTSPKLSWESQHVARKRTQSSTIKFPFGDIKNINIKNDSVFNNNNNNNNSSSSLHNSDFSGTVRHLQNECRTEKISNCSHTLNMNNIDLQAIQSPQLSFKNSHVKAPGEITKCSHMSFPIQPTNENFYEHSFMNNSIENFEKYSTKEYLSSYQTNDNPLTVIKHVKEEFFPDDATEVNISKTFSKHQLISGAEFTNLKRKFSNTNESFLYPGSSKISSDFIKDGQNSSKKTLVSPHPFEIKEEPGKHDKNNIQPLYSDALMKKFHSPSQNLHSQSGAGLIDTTESPYQQTNSVDFPSSHKSFQQQETLSLCHQVTKESSRKPQKEEVKALTEKKFEEILNNCWNVPVDENKELCNLELQNLITKLREHLPKNDSLHKPTLEDIVIATADYALELNMMVSKNNDKTSCNDQKHSSCQKTCSSNIKRPQNGFIRYSVEKRAEVAAKNPHLDNRNISCVLGSQWKLLSKENREHYQREFEAEMKDLRKKHPDWMYSNKKSDVDVVFEMMPTRLRPAEKRKKKVLDIFDDTPIKKKIISKKRTSKRIPRCKENVKNSKCQKCKSKLQNNKRTKSKEKLFYAKDYKDDGNNYKNKNKKNNDSDIFEDTLIIDEAASSLNATAMASEFPINSSSDVILHGNKTYLPPEMNWELQMNPEYPLLDSLFQPSVDSCNQIAFN